MSYLKIYDCSNSVERPNHRGKGGPKQNEIVGYLKKYSLSYGCRFVDTLSEADVAFTNDVFTKEVKESSVRKIKRMDGVFSFKHLQERNEPYYEAAEIADHVIFISKFSSNIYQCLCLNPVALNKMSIAINGADPAIYYPSSPPASLHRRKTGIAIATDWSRPEKRFEAVMEFAEAAQKHSVTILLIGKCEDNVPSNVKKIGYLLDASDVIRQCDFMVNMSYKDACPKVVAQCVNSHLPIFYADSGGVGEMVYSGMFIPDSPTSCIYKIDPSVPELDKDHIADGCRDFLNELDEYKYNARKFNYIETFNNMLKVYFNAIRGDYV